jgi:hypothetical protein
VIFSHDRQVNFSRTVWTTFHCRGMTSSVSVIVSPSLASLPPQHGQAVGPGITTRSRGRCAGNGARTGFLRVNGPTAVPAADAAVASSSAALAAASSSCSSSWSSSLWPRSEDCPYCSRRSLAISSFTCATIASAPEARASASCLALRSAVSAAVSAAISAARISGVVGTGPIVSRSQSPAGTQP